MRIIIVQAEIELAIRQYVLGQINIAEGQEITIDFKNTRGDDGATAEINIQKPVPNDTPAPKSTQSVVQSRSAAPAKTVAQTTASAVLAPAVAATAPIPSETEQSADSASSTSETLDQTTETSDTATAEVLNQKEEEEPSSGFPAKTPEYDAGREAEIAAAEAAAEKPVQKPSFLNAAAAPATADAPVASGKSLFANLTKPVNPKPAAE